MAGLIPYTRDPELAGLMAEDGRLRGELAQLRQAGPDPEARYVKNRLEGARSAVWDAIRRRKAWLRDNGRCTE